jgi:hypothetical protein
MIVLVIDIGGSHVKIARSDRPARRVKLPSGSDLTPRAMVAAVRAATGGWRYDVVSIGYPGPVRDGAPSEDPNNLGGGWVGFDFARAFGKPVRLTNDAAMQALGAYRGGRMLFLGLGTGLGSALVLDGVLQPLELSGLPYRSRTFEAYLGAGGLERLGRRKWRQHVAHAVARLRHGLQVDRLTIGGGNARKLAKVPEGARLTNNADAIRGGILLWADTTARGRLARSRTARTRAGVTRGHSKRSARTRSKRSARARSKKRSARR